MTLQTIGAGGTQQTTQGRTLFDTALLAPIDPWLRLLPYGVPMGIPPKDGQIISKRRIEHIAVKTTPLTEGTAPTPSDLTLTEVTATVQQFGDYVEYSDWFDLTAPDVNVLRILERQGVQAAASLETVAQTEVLGGTNVTYPNGKTARNQIAAVTDVPNVALLDDAIEAMKSRGVPYITSYMLPIQSAEDRQIITVSVAPCYIAFITPKMSKRLKHLSGYESADKYKGAGALLPGEVGKYDHLRFVETTIGFRSATGGAAGAPVQLGLIIGEGAFGISRISGAELLPMLNPPRPQVGDPLGQKGSVGWKATFVAKILNQSRMQRFEAAE